MRKRVFCAFNRINDKRIRTGGCLMSDYIVKLIPTDPFITVSEQSIENARHYIETRVICDCVKSTSSPTPMFIDCGESLETITCPNCGATLDFSWWGNAMDEAYESAFSSLETILPCCKSSASLNDLEYFLPCGFARFAIEILNPLHDIGDDVIRPVESLLCVHCRVVKAHI